FVLRNKYHPTPARQLTENAGATAQQFPACRKVRAWSASKKLAWTGPEPAIDPLLPRCQRRAFDAALRLTFPQFLGDRGAQSKLACALRARISELPNELSLPGGRWRR